MNHVTHPLSPAGISIFYWKSSRNTDIDWILRHNFSFDFFKSLKIILINIVRILMMSAKMATLGFLKTKTFGKMAVTS